MLIMRNQFASYMNTGTGSSAVYTLMGEGFTSLKESKNPKEYSRQYVHETTERTDVVGYATQIDYSVDAYSGNAVITKIKKISDEEKTGTDAQVEIVNVNLFEDTPTYALTEDESIVPGKEYYTRTGSEGSYVYTKVDNPVSSSLSSYYEQTHNYEAFKRNYAIIPDSKGDGTDALVYSGSFKAVGDIVKGTFNGTAFTPVT